MHAALTVRELRDHVAVQLEELRQTFTNLCAVLDKQDFAASRRRLWRGVVVVRFFCAEVRNMCNPGHNLRRVAHVHKTCHDAREAGCRISIVPRRYFLRVGKNLQPARLPERGLRSRRFDDGKGSAGANGNGYLDDSEYRASVA